MAYLCRNMQTSRYVAILYIVVEEIIHLLSGELSLLHSPYCVLQQWPPQWWCSLCCTGGSMSCRQDSPPPSGWEVTLYGGVEAARSWAWATSLTCYPHTFGACELSSDLSGSGRGWGHYELYKRLHHKCIPLAGRKTDLKTDVLPVLRTMPGFIPDGILCVALEGGTGCCCTAHCVYLQRAFPQVGSEL